jgi:peroxiredoxin
VLRALAAAACGAAFGASAATIATSTGDGVPALPARDLAGRELRLADFRGRVLVVNFWATWCAPCVEEMPSLQRLRARFRSHGLEVLAINHQENAARVASFVERHGIAFPVARDHDGSIAIAWGVRVWPTTFVIGPDQHMAFSAVGETDWNAADVESRIRALLPR